jgi:hypothetical protein
MDLFVGDLLAFARQKISPGEGAARGPGRVLAGGMN